MAKFGFQTAVTLIPPLHGETYDFLNNKTPILFVVRI